MYLMKAITKGGSRATATSKMERFVIIVNGWKPLTIITKRSILDVAAALDPPLMTVSETCLNQVKNVANLLRGMMNTFFVFVLMNFQLFHKTGR